MPSNWTDPLQIQKIATGEQVNLWGDSLNVNFDNLADAIKGFQVIALTGDYTLLSGNLTTNEARHAMTKFTGGAGPFTVTLPPKENQMRIWNATTGAITLTAGGSSTVTVDATDIVDVFVDSSFNVKTLGYGGVPLKDYIASVVVGGGASLPSPVGNATKWLTNNGAIAQWSVISVANISDYASDQLAKKAAAAALSTGIAIAFAVAF